MRVLIYHRIDNQSPNDMDRELMQTHLRILQVTAEEAGHSVVGIFCDFMNGLTMERPGLMGVLDAIGAGTAEGVFTKNLSRLARARPVLEQVQKKLQDTGGCLLTAESF